MRWWPVTVRASDAAHRRQIGEALIGAGASSVLEEGDALLTLFPDTVPRELVRRAVRRVSITAVCTCDASREVDVQATLHGTVGVHREGRIAIAPPWLVHEAQAILANGCLDVPGGAASGTTPNEHEHTTARHLVLIEPGMAFGTGEHATTRAALRLLEHALHPGDVVADLGAGSAVLSIAAAMLGARQVVAIEMDEHAAAEGERNAQRNGVDDRVTVLCGDAAALLPLVAPVRLVVANILSTVVIALEELMRDALQPGGEAIISGVLAAEREEVLAAFAPRGWNVVEETVDEGWWSARLAVPC
ncbi:MAG TPA: 50S ribosomal protein L11 methyltransferase [Gemmatimonadaceae bacterium]|nr:50S ribosomal protein L11 methyltransferase [Gemmatimonadaceae bacterium]